jgi:hypothetical protein
MIILSKELFPIKDTLLKAQTKCMLNKDKVKIIRNSSLLRTFASQKR